MLQCGISFRILKHNQGQSKMTRCRSNQVLVIEKASRLLDEFRSQDTLTLTELSERLCISKSTVHRLLSTLDRLGFVEKETKPGSYRLGIKLFELGSLVQSRMHLRQIALDYMTELVERTNETAFLMIRDGMRALCIERIEGRHVQSLALRLGGTLPLHAGAGPRVLLAYDTPEILEQYLADEELYAFTEHTITDPDRLRADVAEIQRLGYALSYEDVTIGVAALGVPLFSHEGKTIGALSIAGITPRWTQAYITDMFPDLCDMAAKISARMGWPSKQRLAQYQEASSVQVEKPSLLYHN
jgi:DNA-binding IclR family transcriptional regulator